MLLTFCIIIVYILFAIINFGVLFAHLQRSKLLESERKMKEHVLMSSIVAFFSIIVTPTILFMADFHIYGIKFWPGEAKSHKNFWYMKYKKLKAEQEWMSQYIHDDESNCISIWE